MTAGIDNQVLELINIRPKLRIPAQQGPDPGDQLAKREWFSQVIVCSGIESGDAIIDSGPRGQHQDGGGIAPGAQFATDFESITMRNQNVQDDQVVIVD